MRIRGPVFFARRRRAIAVGLALAVLGVVLHAPGALSRSAMRWNERPHTDVDRDQTILWDWSNPQFAAWWTVPPRG